MRTAIIVWLVVILLAIFGPQTLYTVDETQLVVVTRFGEIRGINTSAGLKIKAPFVDSANRFDKRVLRVDVPPSTLPDSEKEFLDIDAYTRYRITDVRKFFEKLGNLDRAEDRIGRIVISALREEIAQRTKEEIIGARVEETPDGERVVIATESRQQILDSVLASSDQSVKSPENDFGVEILDVRIKRADFPEAAQQNIFARMRAERERISREFRAQGQEERDIIEAAAEKDKAIILADAGKQGNITRGEGEAQAIEIFAKALEQDPEFFVFQRSLEAYKTFLTSNTTVVLSSEADLFQVLEDTAPVPVTERISLVGSIDSLKGNLWTVGGREVRVSGATVINVSGPLDVGEDIYAEGVLQEDGSLLASEVLSGISGRLERKPLVRLVVNQQVVLVDRNTDIQVRIPADPQLVGIVHVDGARRDGQLLATSITEGLRGTLTLQEDSVWTAGATQITINSDTQIEEGADQLGADIAVSLGRARDGTLLALKVSLQRPDDETESLVGAVNGVTQEWNVSGTGRTIIVNEGTVVQLGSDQVGLVVLAGYVQQQDGSLLAEQVRIE